MPGLSQNPGRAGRASAPDQVRRQLRQRDQRDGHRRVRRGGGGPRARARARQARVHQRGRQRQQHRAEQAGRGGRRARAQQRRLRRLRRALQAGRRLRARTRVGGCYGLRRCEACSSQREGGSHAATRQLG